MGHREELLEGAKRCLVEKGYSRTTARDIVAASGTNLASIGYHFGSKEALLTAAVLEVVEEWGEAFATSAPRAADTDALGQMREMWSNYIETLTAQRPLFAASLEAYAVSDHVPELRARFAAAYQLSRRSLPEDLLPELGARIADEDRYAVGSVMLALLGGLTLQWLIDPDNAPSGADMAHGLRKVADVVAGESPPAAATPGS